MRSWMIITLVAGLFLVLAVLDYQAERRQQALTNKVYQQEVALYDSLNTMMDKERVILDSIIVRQQATLNTLRTAEIELKQEASAMTKGR